MTVKTSSNLGPTESLVGDLTKKLEVAQARYRMLLASAQDGILILDGETGRIEEANPIILEMLDCTRADLIGKELWEIGMPHQAVANQAALGILREQGSIRYDNLPLGTRDGASIHVEFVSSVYEVDGRKIIQCNIRDISDRKQAEEELRQRAHQLTEADRRKNEFLAMLAHELRNPLAPIHNAVQLLRENGSPDPNIVWAGEVIERQVRHMARMVDDLLDVARITRGKINLQKEAIAVSAAVNRALEMVGPLIEAGKHHLTVALPPGPVQVHGDLARLAQILTNLLNNAVKFTEEGGHIGIAVETRGSEVLIKVRDTGVGIPANYLPHVFDLFSQEDRSLERTHGGLGIGLTLVRILVQMHGGSIEAFSAGTGQGSEFIVHLPLLTDQASPAQAPATVNKPAPEKNARRILIVDDNLDGAKSLSLLLKAKGHDVQIAHDGPAALETARNWPPDVVLLDIGLPQINGLEVARRLRHDLGLDSALLIAMTGYGQDEDRKRSQESGFNAHLIKPLDLDVLYRLLA